MTFKLLYGGSDLSCTSCADYLLAYMTQSSCLTWHLPEIWLMLYEVTIIVVLPYSHTSYTWTPIAWEFKYSNYVPTGVCFNAGLTNGYSTESERVVFPVQESQESHTHPQAQLNGMRIDDEDRVTEDGKCTCTTMHIPWPMCRCTTNNHWSVECMECEVWILVVVMPQSFGLVTPLV